MPERVPVFLDESGLRWRRVRLAVRAAAVATSIVALTVIIAALVLPNLGALSETLMPPQRALGQPARFAITRKTRALLNARRKLFGALSHTPAPPAQRPARIAVRPAPAFRPIPPAAERRDAIVAGFYVNWDENSRVSLEFHKERLDWVVPEWVFVARGGDSLEFRLDQPPGAAQQLFQSLGTVPAERRPHVVAMLTNYDSRAGRFSSPSWLTRLIGTPANRARAVAQLRDFVRAYRPYGVGGITIDLEEYPESLDPAVIAFAAELRAALQPLGAIVAQTLATDIDPARAGRLAAPNDYVFLMLYDEHYGKSEAGPVASQAWYEKWARDYLQYIPANKAIFAMGAYGYHWSDAPGVAASGVNFEAAVDSARSKHVAISWDSVALNPYVTWTDPDSTDHVMWFLDGVTAYNQAKAAESMGAAGVGIWHLGDEDPSLWNVLGRHGLDGPPSRLADIDTLYQTQFVGDGELLRIPDVPRRGRRALRTDPTTGLVTSERVTELPSPFVVVRAGVDTARSDGHGGLAGRKIALTFDDGPDGRWTPVILDTLRAHGVPATFFLIGQNVQAHIALTRRIYNEGHEIGNHTFTHPNLSLVPGFITRLQLDATERLLEAVLNRRTAFFRPPLFGDATPSTADEQVPVAIATRLGFVTAGLEIDSHDWDQPRMTARAIIDTTLEQHDDPTHTGNVILLHDGGGNRARTVEALGPLIDSLRARGDTLVPLSQLIGRTRDQAMPELPGSSFLLRAAELAAFGSVGFLEWALYWVMTVAVVLGVGRLVFVLALAAVQRVRSHRRGMRLDAAAAAGHPTPGHAYAPSVSVIVPAYNEEKVIIKTIASLLRQEYAGPLEIVVVDDGSPDDTYAIASEAYGGHGQVRVFRKPNGGKASALNFGIAQAQGDVVIGLDADTVFTPHTVAELVAPLADPRVGAVAGNAKVGNRVNLVTQWQAVEYVTSQNLDRRAFSLLDCITVVPGAVGAWRRELVIEAGGFSDDTLAEDQDLTLEIRRRGHSIAYADEAIAYTEAPDTLRGLARQRFRWSFGTLQCMWKHRDALFGPKYGTLGFVAMPNVWLFQLLLSALGPITDLMFVYALVSVKLDQIQHGATYALVNLEKVLAYYALFLFVDWFTAVVAFLMEPREDRRLTWLIVIQRFAYRQVMYWVVLRSFAAALRGHVVGWGKLERKATVEVPA
ncbi:polysaccharide deacetylase [Gemmatirosa kalamazoonensis]|uniref:Polysaccharide deacetylase n=1 Tax=Gemmatirosa kalamazoonensis TaxID=861299 RepID=W0R952_9BACT|nr:glycosyltransferase [Gemmatirosa kalamazoonensis]AHG87644.1 polysaccharide deacetylase [Gemmatirosa kalamazoonensis]